MRVLITVSIGVLALSGALSDPALGGGIDVRRQSGGATAVVQTAGSSEAAASDGPKRESPYSSCRASNAVWGRVLANIAVKPGATSQWMRCDRKDNGLTDQFLQQLGGGPPPPPPTDVVAAQAASTLQLALPEVATAPPQGGVQLAGVDVWFWVTNNRPAQATATVPGLSATVTATPTATHLAFADGTRVDCAGGGTPYDRARPGRQQHSTCTRVFRDRGTQRVDVTVDWAITWTASTGEAGILPAVGRTTTLVLPVQEGQAVTD
jgi:hypothetical protein